MTQGGRTLRHLSHARRHPRRRTTHHTVLAHAHSVIKSLLSYTKNSLITQLLTLQAVAQRALKKCLQRVSSVAGCGIGVVRLPCLIPHQHTLCRIVATNASEFSRILQVNSIRTWWHGNEPNPHKTKLRLSSSLCLITYHCRHRTSSAGKTFARRSKMPIMPSISAMGTGKYFGGILVRRNRMSACSLAVRALPGPPMGSNWLTLLGSVRAEDEEAVVVYRENRVSE